MSLEQASMIQGVLASQPLPGILKQIANTSLDGCLYVKHPSVTWAIYVQEGQLTYATHTVDPTDRLDSQLRRLSHHCSALNDEVRTQARLMIDIHKPTARQPSVDYQAIKALIEQQHLTPDDANTLITRLSRDALVFALCLQEGSYYFDANITLQPALDQINLPGLVAHCQKYLQAWQSLGPEISSPNQRPYFSSQNYNHSKLSPNQVLRLGKLLRGFSFKQLEAILDQDAFKIAQSFYPLIMDRSILLRDPQFPFNQLPKIPELSQGNASPEQSSPETSVFDSLIHHETSTKIYRIACIDDSPSVLNAIQSFLDDESLCLTLINNPVRALVEIIRVKPHLILLDVGMPRVDGYELCRLIRRNSSFKKTPIIMVTGNTGLIDRARAKVAGATDYMTKPFTQDELSKMVFRYLS